MPVDHTRNLPANNPPEPDGRNILVVKKKKGKEAHDKIMEWVATSPGFIEGYAEDRLGGPIKLYDYQAKVMYDKSSFIHGDKSRQIGWSFGTACESLSKSHLHLPYTAIFISINQEEANEKIVFAREVYDSLPLDVKKKCMVDNKKSLEFEDYDGDRRSRTRLISHAQREPRGKGFNTDVFLDESAHYIYGEKIYTAAVPIITRGTGRLVTGSTPLGKRGIHYLLKDDPTNRRIFSYHKIYWWDCPDLVKEGKFDEAKKEASYLTTEERVLKYANDKLVAIFVSMALETFQQEYELYVVDESVSYFPLDLIHTCCYETPLDPIFSEKDEDSEAIEGLFNIQKIHTNIDFKLYKTIEDLALDIQKQKISPTLLAGLDVGRRRHNTEFSIIEEISNLQIVRFLKSFDKVRFASQKKFLENALDTFPRMKLAIDNNAIGMNLAEDLWLKYRSRIERIEFVNQWKVRASTNMRIRFEGQSIGIPYLKQLVNQIHSIKRSITDHGNFKFDAEANKQHHGDMYWSIALASHIGREPAKSVISLPIAATSGVVKGNRILTIPQSRVIKPSGRERLTAKHSFEPPRIESLFKTSGAI